MIKENGWENESWKKPFESKKNLRANLELTSS
jgi:hypothetical protein